jgi:hypothetical protein
MRAHEWTVRFKKENATTVMYDYIAETGDLILRRGTSKAAIEGCFREQEKKFKSICLYCPDRLDEEMFLEAMQELLPNEYNIAVTEMMRNRMRQKQRSISIVSRRRMEEAKQEPDPHMRLALVLAAILERLELSREANEIFS